MERVGSGSKTVKNHDLGLQTYQTVAGSVEESGEVGGWPTDRP